jgi:hypothetical protein
VKRIAAIPISVLLLGLSGIAAAGAAETHTTMTAPRQVSHGDPFARCAIGQYRGSTKGVAAPNTSVEPAIAVDPLHPRHWFGVWQQDRWTDRDGGAKGLVVAHSWNAGRTWRQTPVPFDRCSPRGAAFDRASDPTISVGPDGSAYFAGLMYTEVRRGSNHASELENSAVAVSTSNDGGKTWTRPTLIGADYARASVNDKEWITADPTRSGVAYLVWDRYDTADTAGVIRFSSTVNGGRTWSTPRITLRQQRQATDFNQILVDSSSDALYDIYEDEPTTEHAPGSTLDVRSSHDHGLTWSHADRIANLQLPALHIPGTRAFARGGDGMAAAIDPHTGVLYAVWERKSAGIPRVAFARSVDGGIHWTVRRQISTVKHAPAFLPTIAVNSSGAVGVTYYGLSPARPGATNYFFTFSRNGGTTFHTARRIDSFNVLHAPRTDGGYFVGDYEGLATDGERFVLFWSRASTRSTGVRVASVMP